MKIRTITLFTLLPATLLAGLYLHHTGKTGHDVPTESGTRDYSVLLKKVNGFQYPGSMSDCWQYYQGRLYIGDQEDQLIYVLDRSGNILDTLGEAGSAPWQNQQLRRFRVSTEGIYSVDNSLMTVKLIDSNDEAIFYSKLPRPFWDGVHLSGSRFLMVNDEPENFGFVTWDAKASEYRSLIRFDSLMNLGYVPDIHIAYEGEMVQGQGVSFYVCARAGRFFSFDSRGDLISVNETVDRTPAPKIIERKLNNMVIFERQPDEMINYSAATDDEFVYILSTIAFVPSEEMTIDAYKPDGTYVFSMYVPNHQDNYPVSIIAGQNSIWVMYEDLYIRQFEMVNVPQG